MTDDEKAIYEAASLLAEHGLHVEAVALRCVARRMAALIPHEQPKQVQQEFT